MSELSLSVCEIIHRKAKKILTPGAVAVDATMGNGADTAFLCEAVGASGQVYAFDIQYDALKATEHRLRDDHLADRAILIHDGHENMACYIREQIDCAIFNLGYLPGGDHQLTTTRETTVKGIAEALKLLKPLGAVFIALYWGHPAGEEEKESLESFLSELPASTWKVEMLSFPNRNKAPIYIEIQKKI